MRADPSNSNLRRALNEAGRRLKRARIEAVQRFFEEFVSQLEVRIKDGDQAGFYKHLKGMEGRDRAAFSTSRMKRGCCFVTWASFAIGGRSGSTQCSTLL